MIRATGDRKNVQTLTWTDLAVREFECEKGCDGKRFVCLFNYYTHISFSLILAGILRAGKTRFLGNQAVCRMHSAKMVA